LLDSCCLVDFADLFCYKDKINFPHFPGRIYQVESILAKVSIMLVPALLAVTIHEVSHGYIADRMGDPTARLLGRRNGLVRRHRRRGLRRGRAETSAGGRHRTAAE
jgi:hypothetical protein